MPWNKTNAGIYLSYDNLVIYLSEKFWLSRDHLSVPPSVHTMGNQGEMSLSC